MSFKQKIARGFRYSLTAVSPKLNTKFCYYMKYHKKLDLNNPKTLNEKILWLKLNRYMENPLVIKCADKYAVRDYVKECGCEDILNPLIGAYDTASEIPWDELPDQFVLKWNFGAGMNIICVNKNDFNKDEVFHQLDVWGKKRPWLGYSEMQYKYAPKKIVCEKLINSEELVK